VVKNAFLWRFLRASGKKGAKNLQLFGQFNRVVFSSANNPVVMQEL
jgi:hypothetical protein